MKPYQKFRANLIRYVSTALTVSLLVTLRIETPCSQRGNPNLAGRGMRDAGCGMRDGGCGMGDGGVAVKPCLGLTVRIVIEQERT